jgi:hypothetical protein
MTSTAINYADLSCRHLYWLIVERKDDNAAAELAARLGTVVDYVRKRSYEGCLEATLILQQVGDIR